MKVILTEEEYQKLKVERITFEHRVQEEAGRRFKMALCVFAEELLPLAKDLMGFVPRFSSSPAEFFLEQWRKRANLAREKITNADPFKD